MLIRRSAIVLAIFFLFGATAARGDALEKIGSISGSCMRVIQAALPIARKNGLHVEHYMVSVFEGESSYVVIFDDPKRSVEQEGSTKTMLAFEIEISKGDLRIVRDNFVR